MLVGLIQYTNGVLMIITEEDWFTIAKSAAESDFRICVLEDIVGKLLKCVPGAITAQDERYFKEMAYFNTQQKYPLVNLEPLEV